MQTFPWILDLHLLGVHKFEIQLAGLILIVAVATAFDVRYRRIPNWLVAIGTVCAFAFHALAPTGDGTLFALLGLLVGFSALLPLYAFGVMGAGDVKLMAMVGSFLGATQAFHAVLATLVAGGILSIVVAVRSRMLTQVVLNLQSIVASKLSSVATGISAPEPLPSVGKMPYAVAIAAGTLIQIFALRA